MKTMGAASPPAITTRLVLWYLVSTLLILLCTNSFQFRALHADLEREDNDFLAERLATLRSVIACQPDTASALRDQMPSNSPGQHLRYLVRVQDARGRTILESPGMSELPPGQFPPPLPSGDQIGHGVRHRGARDRQYLLNSVWARGGGDPNFRLVQMALDITGEEFLIAKYRGKMALSALIGLLLAGGLGMLGASRGLRPLQRMAATVARISETDLHQRIGTGAWPRELAQLTDALDAMLARLEESFARLSEFSVNLAHELRTPINNLRGEAEVALSRARSKEEYRRIIESSIEEYERLSRMVGDILFLARPDQGMSPRVVDLGEEVEALADYYRTLAEDQQIALSVRGEGCVSVDLDLFRRTLGTVISNALHYSSAGGRIALSITAREGGGTDITVADDGMGIGANDLPRIFDRFYRSAQARQRHNQGSGLGLAVVRSVMTLHGGDVAVSSELGRGTVVTLSFPAPPSLALPHQREQR